MLVIVNLPTGRKTLAGLKLVITKQHWKSSTLDEEMNGLGDDRFAWGERGEHELSINKKKRRRKRKEKGKESKGSYCRVSIRSALICYPKRVRKESINNQKECLT